MRRARPSLPEPRSGVFQAALPFAGFFFCFWVFILREPVGDAAWMAAGSGLTFGMFAGPDLRGVTERVRVDDPVSFMARVNVALAELDYHPETHVHGLVTYKPSLHHALAGRLSVQLKDGEALVVGRRFYVRRLLRKLGAEPRGRRWRITRTNPLPTP